MLQVILLLNIRSGTKDKYILTRKYNRNITLKNDKKNIREFVTKRKEIIYLKI